VDEVRQEWFQRAAAGKSRLEVFGWWKMKKETRRRMVKSGER